MNRHSVYIRKEAVDNNMKLVIFLSLAVLAACDYSGSEPEVSPSAYVVPEKADIRKDNVISIQPGKSFFSFKNYYQGAFLPARFPPANFFSSAPFPSFNYPLKAFNYAASPQGILPPISQIVPPISQILPPIFGNTKPALPSPSPVVPSQILPPVSNPFLNKFTFSYYSAPYQVPFIFPSSFSFPPTNFFPATIQKQPAKIQPETLSTSYGPPTSTPVEVEPSGPAETSAPFEPSPVSFPYEPATPEAPETAAPHKPAQEYGLPSSK